MKTLLAVDPGGTTGWALADHETGELLTAGEMPPYEFELVAEGMSLDLGSTLTIVCERFTIDQRTIKLTRGGAHDALDVIGVLKYLSLRDCGRPLSLQELSAKDLFPNPWLKRRGYWHKGGAGHANDALRHLCFRLKLDGVISISGNGET